MDLSRKLRQSRDKEMNVSTKQNNYIYFLPCNWLKHNTLIIEKKTPQSAWERLSFSISKLRQIKRFRKFFKSLFSFSVIAWMSIIQSVVFCDICPWAWTWKQASLLQWQRNSSQHFRQKEHVKQVTVQLF